MLRTVAVSLAALIFAVPGVALADNAPTPNEAAGSIGIGDTPSSRAREQAQAKPVAEEERFTATVDAVIGFGSTPIVDQRIVGPLVYDESRSEKKTRYATGSFDFALDYKLTDHLHLGAMLPLGVGSVFPAEGTRGSSLIGNVSVGGAYSTLLRDDLRLTGGIMVALPTASGEADVPDDTYLATSGHINQTDYDRYSLNQAFERSRGREDTASYAPKHLGLVPKVSVLYTGIQRVELEAYAKYESLHATGTTASYEGDVVVLGRGTYMFNQYVDGTLRVWTNIPTAGPDTAVAAAEPQIRGHLGWLTPYAGVILPIAGPNLTSPYNVGVRFAVAGRF